MTHTRLLFCLFALALGAAACSDSTTTYRDAGTGSGGRLGAGGAGYGGSVGLGGIFGSGGTAGAGNGGATGFGGATTGVGGTGGSVVGQGGAGGTMVPDGGTALDGSAGDGAAIDAATVDSALDAGEDTVAVDDAGAPVCGPFPNGGAPIDGGATPSSLMSFFVSSLTSVTGNLGGLAGADQRCQTLAAAVGVPSPLWRAYLSVEHNPAGTGPSVNARDRIGAGPWYNARGELVAADLASLHARKGDASVFLDEHGDMINGQWTGSPSPVEHDVLTGSNPDGTVALGKTCADWTSEAGPGDGGVPDGGGGLVARVGHSDGLGPRCSSSTSPIDYTSWNSSHDNAGCNNTEPLGGAGRIYCFKANQ